MDCERFLAVFSDYRDGELEASAAERIRVHLGVCASCRRYESTVERGVRLLRAAPRLKAAEDFRPRLSHRIYHLVDGERLARSSAGSGAALPTAVGVAVLLIAAAWLPAIRHAGPGVIDLSAIVVTREPVGAGGFLGRPAPQDAAWNAEVEPASGAAAGLAWNAAAEPASDAAPGLARSAAARAWSGTSGPAAPGGAVPALHLAPEAMSGGADFMFGGVDATSGELRQDLLSFAYAPLYGRPQPESLADLRPGFE